MIQRCARFLAQPRGGARLSSTSPVFQAATAVLKHLLHSEEAKTPRTPSTKPERRGSNRLPSNAHQITIRVTFSPSCHGETFLGRHFSVGREPVGRSASPRPLADRRRDPNRRAPTTSPFLDTLACLHRRTALAPTNPGRRVDCGRQRAAVPTCSMPDVASSISAFCAGT